MSIVYDGVNGDGQGNLFEGLKLWIAHRVPQRDRWVNLVEVRVPFQLALPT